MARRYVRIYVNEKEVRTFGGNGSEVRMVRDQYNRMTKEEFLEQHPKFTDECKDKFKITTCYY